ncbi:MAG: nucleotidyltransferase substrate binding protein [Gammaproteobacteria bacterium]|nr:nucleotidyltransferase substrate binding protein [Gammaproteobacteria bacterium]
MTSDKPDISPFERAISRLEEGIARYKLDENDDQIRDGLIQRFEFTYELGHKMLKRYLEYASPNLGEVDEMTVQDMIRAAIRQNGVVVQDPRSL